MRVVREPCSQNAKVDMVTEMYVLSPACAILGPVTILAPSVAGKGEGFGCNSNKFAGKGGGL